MLRLRSMLFSHRVVALFAILALCPSFIVAKVIQFNNCKSEFNVHEVAVEPCDDNGSTCSLYRGRNATISILFEPTRDISEMKALVYGISKEALVGKVPFNLPNPDVCKDSNIECPMKAGQQYIYRQTLPILKVYPKLTVLIKWELVEPTADESVKTPSPVCIIIRAVIADPPDS